MACSAAYVIVHASNDETIVLYIVIETMLVIPGHYSLDKASKMFSIYITIIYISSHSNSKAFV